MQEVFTVSADSGLKARSFENLSVIGKVINPHLAEYLAKEGWVLKADGRWINFEKLVG